MGRIVDFVVVFEDGVRKRHYHETERGKVVFFVVQLEIKVKDEWHVPNPTASDREIPSNVTDKSHFD